MPLLHCAGDGKTVQAFAPSPHNATHSPLHTFTTTIPGQRFKLVGLVKKVIQRSGFAGLVGLPAIHLVDERLHLI